MDLLQLKYILAIAESESMTKAAEQLHISQSALSLSYRRLEEELGVKLFTREGRTLRLTSLGQTFCTRARGILQMVSELERELTTSNVVEYTSEVGDFTNEARMLFASFFPDQGILENRENAIDTIKSLRDGTVPFALTCYDHSDDTLVSERIMVEPMYGFVKESSSMAKKAALTIFDIADGVLVSQKPDYSIARVMAGFFEAAGIPLPRRHFVGDPEAMSLTVFNGMGSTFIPRSVVNLWARSPFDMAPGTKMIPMEEEFCRREIYLTYLRNAPRPPVVQHYMEYLRHFGRLAQRLEDIPNPMEMASYAEKYWPEFSNGSPAGPAPVFSGGTVAFAGTL